MLISSIHKSLQRCVQDIIDDCKDKTGNRDITYWSFENRADENELPKNSLIGISGFEFHENTGLWLIRLGVAISPWKDLNLDLHTRFLDVIHENLGEKRKVNLLDGHTGELVSELAVVDFHIAPVSASEMRTYRVVSCELLRTDTAVP